MLPGANEMHLSIVCFSTRYGQLRKNTHGFRVAKGQAEFLLLLLELAVFDHQLSVVFASDNALETVSDRCLVWENLGSENGKGDILGREGREWRHSHFVAVVRKLTTLAKHILLQLLFRFRRIGVKAESRAWGLTFFESWLSRTNQSGENSCGNSGFSYRRKWRMRICFTETIKLVVFILTKIHLLSYIFTGAYWRAPPWWDDQGFLCGSLRSKFGIDIKWGSVLQMQEPGVGGAYL